MNLINYLLSSCLFIDVGGFEKFFRIFKIMTCDHIRIKNKTKLKNLVSVSNYEQKLWSFQI